MWFRRVSKVLLSHACKRTALARRRPGRRREDCRLQFQSLEDRYLLSFNPAVGYPVGPSPALAERVLAGDFNHDDRLDVVVGSAASTTLSVLLGNGDGTLQPAVTSATAQPHSSIAVGDLNADGNADLITTANILVLSPYDYADLSQAVSVLLGNGDGTFQPEQFLALSGIPRAAALGHFDSDGHMDLAVTYYQPFWSCNWEGECWLFTLGGVDVRRGNGDGTFSAATSYSLAWDDPWGLAIADFDGDGRVDLFTSDAWGSHVRILPGNGDGTFQQPIDSFGTITSGPSGSYTDPTHSVTPADFNGDGILDVLGGNVSYSGAEAYPAIWFGNGDGTFDDPQRLGSGASPGAADFDGDGELDVVSIERSLDRLAVLLGNGDGTFHEAQHHAVGSSPASLVVKDFNNDGLPDCATANYLSNDVSMLINDGDWSAPLTPLISITDVSITEGNTGTKNAVFTVTLSSISAEPVTVDYETADGSATAGMDYSATAGTLRFDPGQTAKTVSVSVKGDRIGERNEIFFVNLSRATNAVVADAQGVATIVDDEPTLLVDDVTLPEGNRSTTVFVVTVSLSAVYDADVSVRFATADGSATVVGGDYRSASGTLTIAAGQRSGGITVLVNGDRSNEPDEWYYVNLSDPVGATLFDSQAVATIVNDDKKTAVKSKRAASFVLPISGVSPTAAYAEEDAGEATAAETSTRLLPATNAQPLALPRRMASGDRHVEVVDFVFSLDDADELLIDAVAVYALE